MEFQALAWEARDDSRGQCGVDIYGRTPGGEGVCCRCPFRPFLYVAEDVFPRVQALAYRRSIVFECTYERRKIMHGFRGEREERVVCVRTASKAAFRRLVWAATEEGLATYETNVDVELKFLHTYDLESTGWIGIDEGGFDEGTQDSDAAPGDRRILVTDASRLRPLRTRAVLGAHVVASYDIECVAVEEGRFVDPRYDPIVQIATTFQRMNEADPYLKVLYTLGECAEIEGVDRVVSCASEDILLCLWAADLRQADVYLGYNTCGFDNKYIHDRATRLGVAHRMRLGRRGVELAIRETRSVTKAHGNVEMTFFEAPGVWQIDLLPYLRKEYKLPSYKLDKVAAHFLRESKVDLPIAEMARLYASNRPEDLARIGAYCVQDTLLPLRLVRRLRVYGNAMEMARATHVPVAYIIPRGQQIRVFSQIVREAGRAGYVVPTLDRDHREEEDEREEEEEQRTAGAVAMTVRYKGATVLEARVGAYDADIVVCLDFASLYPSIIRAHNMCHSTVVLDPAYGALPDVQYYEIEGVRFAQRPAGILPRLLEEFSAFRKQAKKDMADAREAGDPELEALFNAKQLAFKVCSNSAYGFCGVERGFLPCMAVAASVTATGRDMIRRTKETIESTYPDAEVVYGDTDSVMVRCRGWTDMERAFAWGHEAAALVTRLFRKPIELEFEKCYFPYLLYGKKMYAGLMYTGPSAPEKIDVKGLKVVRRDSCRWIVELYDAVLPLLMARRLTDAVRVVNDAVRAIEGATVPMEKLVMSKTLTYEYRSGTGVVKLADLLDASRHPVVRMPHIYVAWKQARRMPGNAPKAGERVWFAIAERASDELRPRVPADADLLCYRAEDPDFMRSGHVRPDVRYYRDRVLRPAMRILFGILLGAETDRKLFQPSQRDIRAFFGAPPKRLRQK